MINRAAPDASPRLVLTDVEITLIDRLAASRKNEQPGRTLSHYLTQIARLGGYLARAHDPPPGNIVIWRGWSRLMDIKIGANVSCNTCRSFNRIPVKAIFDLRRTYSCGAVSLAGFISASIFCAAGDAVCRVQGRLRGRDSPPQDRSSWDRSSNVIDALCYQNSGKRSP